MIKYFLAFLLLSLNILVAQSEIEVDPPYNIKTVTFVQNNQNSIALFSLTDSFQLQFDDLFANEANYYYEIVHCDYDWKPSQLSKSEYINGFDNIRIQNYTNSVNALQNYSHYTLELPNRQTQFRVSGNYIIKILDEDRQTVFSRKFILYEDLVSVPVQIKRARNLSVINEMHNVEFSVLSPNILFQNPLKNVKVLIMQNGQFDTAITNIKPQYTIGNDLIYKYDKETQFFGGNEFNYFENKDIRASTSNVNYIDSNGGIYNSHLYTNDARGNKPYTFYPDINGNFLVLNINAENNAIEADYAWVFFTLSAPTYFGKKDIYINGMFNNYALVPENKMDFNKAKNVYEKAIMIKQGFTNFQYVISDANGNIDQGNAIDGNFYQTESNYFVIAYYRENNARYDRVVGKGVASSLNIVN